MGVFGGLLAILAALACAPACAVAAEQAGEVDADRLLARAESAIAEAGDTTDPARQDALYDEAIAAYRGVIGAGIENASLRRNIGTVYVLKGDVGRAVVELRRAVRLDPTDDRVTESLAAARGLVRTEVSPGVRTKTVDAAFFWRGFVPRGVMLWIGVGGWVVLWLGATARLVGRRGIGLAAIGAVVCVLTVGSLAAERVLLSMNPAGVVVEDGVTGYRGPSEAVFEATFEEPIRAGVEGAILERRDGWVRLRLRSGAETWVRGSSIEVV